MWPENRATAQARIADEGLAQVTGQSGGGAARRPFPAIGAGFRMASPPSIRLGVDIGGTFTDVALEVGERRFTAKGLTTPRAPEEGVLTIVRTRDRRAPASQPGEVDLIIHGTTLATNALIERKGAKTALLTTEGFRDVVEIRHENRFEQYDVNIDLPPPLVPRRLRLPIRERVDAQGEVLMPLDEASLASAIDTLAGAENRGGRGRAPAQLHQSGSRAPRRRGGRAAAAAICRSRCHPTSRRRCANTSGSRPLAPMPIIQPLMGQLPHKA